MQVSKTPKKFHQKIFVVKPVVKVFHSSHPSCQRRKIFSKRQCVLEPSKLKYRLYITQSETNQNTPMNTITTMNTNFVTLFFAFTPSLQIKEIYIHTILINSNLSIRGTLLFRLFSYIFLQSRMTPKVTALKDM